MRDIPSMKEDHISQIPALQLLQNLGWKYLTPQEALNQRRGKLGNVLLEGILEEQLRKINSIHYKSETYAFSEGNIQAAVMALREVLFDGLIRTNEKIYDLLSLGKSLQQSISGDLKSFSLHYIDWDNPENNVFHVTEEFAVERTGSHKTCRPDIVLFINGIPVSVIECKRPDLATEDPIEQAISQQIRNQKVDYIPKLFLYSQLLMGISKNEAKYGTTGTPMKFWSLWRENIDEEALRKTINTPISNEQKDKLFSDRFKYVRVYFDELEQDDREITVQDRALYGLCRPERLVELIFRYIIFDAGDKKIARYQQYFCVTKIMDRITRTDQGQARQGGVVWHTQGSGKSLTMVMLAKAISLEPSIDQHKIVLVTDRVDLDDQIWTTFGHCGKEVVQANTGNHLVDLIESNKDTIIATVIDKFEAAVKKRDVRDESRNIFVLVDESQRSQYGPLHANMKKVLPNACYIGFTGTPLMKKDKNTVERFGGLIDSYTITQAVNDEAVVPLLYEGRDVEQFVEKKTIDSWFDRFTAPLSKEQATDLKKKFARADQLNRAEQKVMAIAWDISAHFQDNWKGTPFKAQLVAPRKVTALLYKKFLDEFGIVTSEVLISGPDQREGHEELHADPDDAVVRFWGHMMDKYGNEKAYQKALINSFKFGDDPEIIIVVDKLLVGFDSPRNTILYLTKSIKDHSLLQAIARVNRLFEGKDFGYIIDYYGVLGELHTAMDLYAKLSDFDEEDLVGTLTDVSAEVGKLPQRHSDLWDIFKGIKSKKDEEAYEQLLADGKKRHDFYERLSVYARTLAIALGTVKFIEDTPVSKVQKYKDDLKFFAHLRTSVRRRYAEEVDFKEYEKKIQKLIDTHVGAGEVEPITDLVNIFDKEAFEKEVEKNTNIGSKADTIAHRTAKAINEKMKEDPAFYKKFSKMLEEAIKTYRDKRLADLDYLAKVQSIMLAVQNRTGDEIPDTLKNHEVAKAFYGIAQDVLKAHEEWSGSLEDVGTEIALGIDKIIQGNKIVNWENNNDVQNRMRNLIEDYLFEVKDQYGIELSFEDIDQIMEDCLDVAKVRYAA